LDFVYTFPPRDPLGPWGHYGMWVLIVVIFGAIPFINYLLDHPRKRFKAIFKGLIFVAISSFFLHAWTYNPDYLEEIRISEGTMRARRHISGTEIWYSHEIVSIRLVDSGRSLTEYRIGITTSTGEEYQIGPFSESERLQVAEELMKALSMTRCRTGSMCWAKRTE